MTGTECENSLDANVTCLPCTIMTAMLRSSGECPLPIWPAVLVAGDALDDDFDLEGGSDSEGSGASASDDSGPPAAKASLQQRREARAAGSHPLQKSFRAAAAELLQKHGVRPAVQAVDASDDDVGPSSSDEEEEQDTSDNDSDASSSDDQGAAGGSGEQGSGEDDAVGSADGHIPAAVSSSSDSEGSPGSSGAPDQHLAGGLEAIQRAGAQAAPRRLAALQRTAGGRAPHELQQPTLIPEDPIAQAVQRIPETHAEFAAAVAGLNATQLQQAVHEIRTRHAAALAAEHRHKLQVCLRALVPCAERTSSNL